MPAPVNLSSRDINNAFEEGLGSYKSVASQVCKLVIDSLSTVKYNGLYRPPLPVRWSSPSRTYKGALSQTYSVQNQTYESTLVFNGQDFDGDQTGQIMGSISQFGQMDAIHDDVLFAGALDNGASDTGTFDGVAFFHATSHKLSDDTVQANTASGGNLTETALTDADAAAVVSLGMSKLWNLKDFSNVSVPHNLSGRTAIICPTPAYAAINRYVNGGVVWGTGASTQGAGISQTGMDQTLVYKLPMLTGTNVYFIAMDARPSFILQKQSAKPEIRDWTNGWQHKVVEDDNYIVSFKMRKALAYFDHFSIFRIAYT